MTNGHPYLHMISSCKNSLVYYELFEGMAFPSINLLVPHIAITAKLFPEEVVGKTKQSKYHA